MEILTIIMFRQVTLRMHASHYSQEDENDQMREMF